MFLLYYVLAVLKFYSIAVAFDFVVKDEYCILKFLKV